jgi:hypothetical protein
LIYLLFIITTGKFLGTNSKLGMFGQVRSIPQSVNIKQSEEKLRRVEPPAEIDQKLNAGLERGPGVFIPNTSEQKSVTCNDGVSELTTDESKACTNHGGTKLQIPPGK